MSLLEIINARFLKKIFPSSYQYIKFAFIGSHINRYQNIKTIVSNNFFIRYLSKVNLNIEI